MKTFKDIEKYIDNLRANEVSEYLFKIEDNNKWIIDVFDSGFDLIIENINNPNEKMYIGTIDFMNQLDQGSVRFSSKDKSGCYQYPFTYMDIDYIINDYLLIVFQRLFEMEKGQIMFSLICDIIDMI